SGFEWIPKGFDIKVIHIFVSLWDLLVEPRQTIFRLELVNLGPTFPIREVSSGDSTVSFPSAIFGVVRVVALVYECFVDCFFAVCHESPDGLKYSKKLPTWQGSFF